MAIRTRKIQTSDLDLVDQVFFLKTDSGAAYVTILQAAGYEKSRVKIQHVLEGNIDGAVREGIVDVPNEHLEVVLDIL